MQINKMELWPIEMFEFLTSYKNITIKPAQIDNSFERTNESTKRNR